MSYHISGQSQIKVKCVYIKKSKTYINYFTVKKSKSKEIECVYSKSKQKKNQMRKMNIKLEKSKRTIIPSLIMSSYVVTYMKNSSQLEIKKYVYSKNQKTIRLC